MTAVDIRVLPDTHTTLTCPDCKGAGERNRDWQRDPESGTYYPVSTPVCVRCDGTGEISVEAGPCDGCSPTAELIDLDDNQCTHGLVLCEDHRDVCRECLAEGGDPDLDPWDER